MVIFSWHEFLIKMFNRQKNKISFTPSFFCKYNECFDVFKSWTWWQIYFLSFIFYFHVLHFFFEFHTILNICWIFINNLGKLYDVLDLMPFQTVNRSNVKWVVEDVILVNRLKLKALYDVLSICFGLNICVPLFKDCSKVVQSSFMLNSVFLPLYHI